MRMKLAAFILVIIFSAATIQPVFSGWENYELATSATESSKPAEGCCAASASCKMPAKKQDKKDCSGNRCSPLMACPAGNFYLPNYSFISIAPLIITRNKNTLINDNRVATNLTECWHPPEII